MTGKEDYMAIWNREVSTKMYYVKVSGKGTAGRLAIFEQTSLSQGKGTPLHNHNAQDEIFYVLKGGYYFKVGEDKYYLKVGTIFFWAVKGPHAWAQVSAKGTMAVILQHA